MPESQANPIPTTFQKTCERADCGRAFETVDDWRIVCPLCASISQGAAEIELKEKWLAEEIAKYAIVKDVVARLRAASIMPLKLLSNISDAVIVVPRDRAQWLEISMAVHDLLPAGDWKRSQVYNQPRLEYKKEIPIGEKLRPVTFTIGDVEPPPSCKIVYENVLVPARVEKKAKLVCDDAKEGA